MGSITDIANLFLNAIKGFVSTGSGAAEGFVNTGSAVANGVFGEALGSVRGVVNN